MIVIKYNPTDVISDGRFWAVRGTLIKDGNKYACMATLPKKLSKSEAVRFFSNDFPYDGIACDYSNAINSRGTKVLRATEGVLRDRGLDIHVGSLISNSQLCWLVGTHFEGILLKNSKVAFKEISDIKNSELVIFRRDDEIA